MTTGEVAKICSVAPRTVSKWFDSGQLQGYRIPGSRDRRIPLAQLIEFMKAHGIPMTALEGDVTRVLVAAPDSSEITAAASGLSRIDRYKLETATNDFEAGMRAGDFRPHVILVDMLAKSIDADEILKNLRSNPTLTTTSVVAVTKVLTNGQKRGLLRKGFNAVLSSPYEFKDIVGIIETATEIKTQT